MAPSDPLYSIILAGGKGRRMGSRDKHKVCFPVAGVPAIVRAIDTYNRLGVTQNVVVVGDMAGQVMETVGRQFSNVIFAYQPEAIGTGDAARCGMQALAAADDRARILVAAGDKLIEGATLARLLEQFERTGADLTILVSPADVAGSSAGRILFRANGSPLSIVEHSDIQVRACRAALCKLLEASSEKEWARSRVNAVIAEHLGQSATWEKVLGGWRANGQPANGKKESIGRNELLTRLGELPRDFRFDRAGPGITPAEARTSRYQNESIYLVRKGALHYGLNHMSRDNAQGEEYLTDAIGAILLASEGSELQYGANVLATGRPEEVMSYNNPEELLLIEDRLQQHRHHVLSQLSERLGSARFRTVDQWLQIFSSPEDVSQITDVLRGYYGDNPELLAERQRTYRQTLSYFRDLFGGDRRAIVVRSPGRVNLMGRHIDWQGGHCNLMAIDQEAIMVIAPRQDDRIEIRNAQRETFPDASISLSRLISQLNWDDWLSCVNGQEQQRRLRQAAGNWSLYIEAALLRLQMEYREQMLTGMDVAVHSNIPIAAGMSSSSALVVAAGEGAVALNGLNLVPRQFVNFCGEGEWFVGTRGGSADHAAMKFGGKGMVVHVKFHDFELLERVRFPSSYKLVVCNSFVQAKKAAGAKAVFNARVASYLVGVELVRLRFPQYAPFVRFIRDIQPETLRVPLEQIYELLLVMPESITVAEARRTFAQEPEAWGKLVPHLEGPDAAAVYPVRGVMLFGISECARARQAVGCLKGQEMVALGELMNTSHEGERCYRVDDQLRAEPFQADIADAYLRGLIQDLKSGDPVRIDRAQLHRQPGAYRCSTSEIDAIVDIARRTAGVMGAQIAGAGLGGCAMVLAEAKAVPILEQRLMDLFYQPKNLPSGIYVCTPAAGSCVIAIEA